MRIFERAKQKDTREEFVKSRIRSEKYKEDELAEMTAYILSESCTRDLERLEAGDYFLDYPAWRLIPKNFHDQKRAVYCFYGNQSYLIKLIAFSLHDLETVFSDRLFSFRTDKKAHDLLREIRANGEIGKYYVLKTDVANYVGSIVPEYLLPMLSKIFLPGDPDFYAFLEWLLMRKKVIDLQGNVIDYCPGGLGGIALANFFMNLYLHEMDVYFASRAAFYSRYSDDILICAPDENVILEYRKRFFEILDRLHLKTNPEKTMVLPPGEAFDLLGMELFKGELSISSHSMKKIKRRIRMFTDEALIKRNTGALLPEEAAKALIRRFHIYFFGTIGTGKTLSWAKWAFPVITQTDCLKEIDHYFQNSLRYVLYGSMKKRNRKIPYEKLNQLGYKSIMYYYHHPLRHPVNLRETCAL